MSSAVTSPALPGSDDDGGASPPLDGGEGSEGAGSISHSASMHSSMPERPYVAVRDCGGDASSRHAAFSCGRQRHHQICLEPGIVWHRSMVQAW
jgi:hypothetical protein